MINQIPKFFNCIINGKNGKGVMNSMELNFDFDFMDTKRRTFVKEKKLRKVYSPTFSVEVINIDSSLELRINTESTIIGLIAGNIMEQNIFVPTVFIAVGKLINIKYPKFVTDHKRIKTTKITLLIEFYKSYGITGAGITIDVRNNKFKNKQGDVVEIARRKIKL